MKFKKLCLQHWPKYIDMHLFQPEVLSNRMAATLVRTCRCQQFIFIITMLCPLVVEVQTMDQDIMHNMTDVDIMRHSMDHPMEHSVIILENMNRF